MLHLVSYITVYRIDIFASDTRDIGATWFDIWNRNIFLHRPVHFDLQVTVELRGMETGQVTFKSGFFIRLTGIYEVRFHTVTYDEFFHFWSQMFFSSKNVNFVKMNIVKYYLIGAFDFLD